jgi:hypothetical protein
MNRKYTQEHIDFIRANINGCPFKELTGMFNERFDMSIKISTMIALADRHGLHNGRNTRFNKGHQSTQFKKGHEPWNKGKKGVVTGGKATQFKPGHKAHNWVPIGSERVNGDGYVDVKVRDGRLQNNWKGKHIITWEKHHGRTVPQGHAVIFGDGNRRNFDPDNLLLVSRKQLVRLNQKKLIQGDARLTNTGIIIADIHNRLGDLRNSKYSAK